MQATNQFIAGTPILNNLADAFSLVRFLRIRPYYDWTEFRDRVVKHERNRPDFAAKRCLAILQPIMMRRKKDASLLLLGDTMLCADLVRISQSKLDGKPLLQLPEKHVHEEWLDFDPEEREIYEAVQTKM